MVEFLENFKISATIEEVISSSGEYLILISPQVKIPDILKTQLKSTDQKKVDARLIFNSNSRLSEEDITFFLELQQLKLYTVENLHAKCYINESQGVIASQNLVDNAPIQNVEMGIKFNKKDDTELFQSIIAYINHIGKICDRVTPDDVQDYLESSNLKVELNNILNKKAIKKEQKPKKPNSFDTIRINYPKAYSKWTEEDETILIAEFKSGKSLEELSNSLKRKPGGIYARLIKLGLVEDENYDKNGNKLKK
jgi:hypothetical protein